MAKITKVRAGAPTPGLIKPIPGPLPKGVIDIGEKKQMDLNNRKHVRGTTTHGQRGVQGFGRKVG